MIAVPIPKTFRNRPYAKQQFREIVEFARRSHPFYQEWLSDETKVPILTREVLLANNDRILNGHAPTTRTSGSTGIPVEIAKSNQRNAMDARDVQRLIQWLGGTVRCTRIIHPSGAPDESVLNIRTCIDEQIDVLRRRYQAEQWIGLTTYPTNGEFLARKILERGIDMSFIRRVGLFAESLDECQESLIRRAFPNAQIWTTYSSMEFGMIAIRCLNHATHHHVMAHKLGLEILDDNDQPCLPGQLGRVVITDYFNRLSPLIRYEIGDLASRSEEVCSVDSFPLLDQIAGKVRGALMHRDRRRVVFTDLSVALRDISGMKQYQVVQHSVEQVCVKYVSNADLTSRINEAIENEFGYLPNEFTTQRTDRIERGANGKFYASLCFC